MDFLSGIYGAAQNDLSQGEQAVLRPEPAIGDLTVKPTKQRMQPEAQFRFCQAKIGIRNGRTQRPPLLFHLPDGLGRDPLEQVIQVCLIHPEMITTQR